MAHPPTGRLTARDSFPRFVPEIRSIEASARLCYHHGQVKKKRPVPASGAPGPNSRRKPDGPGKPRRKAPTKRIPVSGTHRSRAQPLAARTPTADRSHRQSRESAIAAIDAALEKKALMPVLLDVSGQASYTDFIAVVSARSDRQVEAITDNVSSVMRARGCQLIGREGTGNGRWALLDFGDVIVHVFYHPVREFYDIESLWIDAPRVTVQVPPEATLSQSDVLYDTL